MSMAEAPFRENHSLLLTRWSEVRRRLGLGNVSHAGGRLSAWSWRLRSGHAFAIRIVRTSGAYDLGGSEKWIKESVNSL